MRAAVYARRSAERGDDYSLTTQVEACERYAAANGLTVCEITSDNHTGSVPLSQRPNGAGLWGRIVKRQVEAVLVYSLDRLSRADLVDALAMMREILRAGAALYAVDVGRIENLNDIGLIVRSWQSSEERRKIIDRLRRGKLGKSATGWVGVGRVPYGYRKEGLKKTAHLVIDEPHAEVIRSVARWIVEDGQKLRTIARRLNESGVPPPTSLATTWNHGTLAGLLANPILIGQVRYLDRRLNLPDLAILDEATFARIQAMLDANRAKAQRNRKYPYLLAGSAVCACGANLIGVSNVSHGLLHLYYRCGQYARESVTATCPHYRMIRADWLEREAWQYVLDCAQPEQLAAWRAELKRSDAATQAQPWRDRLVQIDREIEQARRRMAAVMAQYGEDARPGVAEAREATIASASALIEARTAERARVAHAVEDEAGRAEQQETALAAVSRLRRRLERANFEQRRQVAEVIGLRATVEWEADHPLASLSSWIGPVRVVRPG